MLQSSANVIWQSNPCPEHNVTLAVASRLYEAPTKQNLLALHKQIYKSKLRNAAHEALLEDMLSLYWSAALGEHLSVLQSRLETGCEAQESCVHS